MAQTKVPDALSEARQLYNDAHYDEAIQLAAEARGVPAMANAASLVFARAHLERYRQGWNAADLGAAREALDDRWPGLQPRDRVELLIALGESLYLDDQIRTRRSLQRGGRAVRNRARSRRPARRAQSRSAVRLVGGRARPSGPAESRSEPARDLRAHPHARRARTRGRRCHRRRRPTGWPRPRRGAATCPAPSAPPRPAGFAPARSARAAAALRTDLDALDAPRDPARTGARPVADVRSASRPRAARAAVAAGQGEGNRWTRRRSSRPRPRRQDFGSRLATASALLASFSAYE